MNSEPSNVVKFYNGEQIPLELHKVRVVQKLHLVPVERRLEAAREAGFNTFQLSTNDVYLDMLTDSGVNAMSDNQIAAMFRADDAYAGSQSFDRLKQAVWDVFGKKYLLPALLAMTAYAGLPYTSLADQPRPARCEQGQKDKDCQPPRETPPKERRPA